MTRRSLLPLLCLLLSTTLSVSLLAAQESGADKDLDSVLRAASRSLAIGDYKAADAAFAKARELSRNAGPETQIAVLIQSGQAVVAKAFADPIPSEELLKSAEQFFHTAVDLAKELPTMRFLANNELAVLSLKRKLYPEALEVLKQQAKDLDAPGVRESWRGEHHYMFGSCYEKLHQTNEALARYQAAAGIEQTRAKAVAGAFRTLRELPAEEGIAKTFALADSWVPGSRRDEATEVDSELVAAEVLKALALWGDQPQASRLLTILLRYYAVMAVTPDKFTEFAQPRLREAAGGHAQLQPAIRALVGLFAADQESPEALQVILAPLLFDQSQRAATAALLTVVGQHYQGVDEDPRRSRQLFRAAASLDGGRLDALLYEVAGLADAALTEDPHGCARCALICSLMCGPDALRDRHFTRLEEWQNVVRIHFLLGQSYARQQCWGSPCNFCSALGQWELARQASAVAQERYPGEYTPVPGLSESLGEAYWATAQCGRAWDNYIDAAESHLQVGNVEFAREAVQSAGQVFHPSCLCECKALRLQKIESQLQSVESPGIDAPGAAAPSEPLDPPAVPRSRRELPPPGDPTR